MGFVHVWRHGGVQKGEQCTAPSTLCLSECGGLSGIGRPQHHQPGFGENLRETETERCLVVVMKIHVVTFVSFAVYLLFFDISDNEGGKI